MIQGIVSLRMGVQDLDIEHCDAYQSPDKVDLVAG